MLVCVDVGNTNICLGIFDRDKLVKKFITQNRYTQVKKFKI